MYSSLNIFWLLLLWAWGSGLGRECYLVRCQPRKVFASQVGSQNTACPVEDAALSGNGRPVSLFCSVGGWKLLQEEHALSCHCIWLSHLLGATLQVVWRQLEDRGSLRWIISWRLRGHYIPYSWAASPFWKGNRVPYLWVPHGEQHTLIAVQ